MSVINKIETNPFVRITMPVVLGIVVARYFAFDTLLLWLLFGLAYVAAWLTRGTAHGHLYIIVSLTLCSAALFTSHKTEYQMADQQQMNLCLQITDNPYTAGRWQQATANIGYFRTIRGAGTDAGNSSVDTWQTVDQKVIIKIDTCYRVMLGDQFACRGYVNRFDRSPAHRDYAALMQTRGFVGTLYVTPGKMICKSPITIATPNSYAKILQNYAVTQLDKLHLTGNEYTIAKTMVAGARQGIDRDLMDKYSRIGASHLLAVSGLHVGIMFAFLNILLYWLPIFPKGHIARNLIVIAAIWLYAATTGLSASVVRAAMMFSGAQLALASTSYRDAVNIMLGTAVVMLCLNPNNLFDISFQLSFTAVFFILLVYPAAFRAVKGRSRIVNFGASLVMIGIVASIATIPLVSYKFGNVPLMGIVIGPLLVICANFILTLSIGWIIAPIPFAGGLVGSLIEWFIRLQNMLVEYGASFALSAIEYRMSAGAIAGCYVVLGAAAVWVWSRDRKETLTLDYDDDK